MLANFFNKTKPEVVFIIALCLFVYFTIANLLFKFDELSWLFFFNRMFYFFCFVLFLILMKFIIKKNNLTQDNSYALLLTVFLLGTFYETLFTNKILITNVILLLSFRKTYSLRSGINTKLKLFDAGFWVGIATLFYSWSIVFVVLIYLGMFIFQKGSFKNLFIPIVGVVLPIFIVFTYSFYVEDLAGFYSLFLLDVSFNYTPYNQFKLLFPIAFLITVALWSIATVTPKVISIGTNFKLLWNLLIVHLLISAVILVLSPVKNGSEMFFIFFPLTIIVANFLQKSESKNFKNLVFYLFLIISVGVYFL